MCGTSSSELSLGLGSDGPEGLFSRVCFWLSCCTPQFRLMYCLYPCPGSVEKLGLNERAPRVGLGDHRSSPSIFLGGDLPLHTSYARWCVLAACIRSGLTTTLRRLPRCRTRSTVGFNHGSEPGAPYCLSCTQSTRSGCVNAPISSDIEEYVLRSEPATLRPLRHTCTEVPVPHPPFPASPEGESGSWWR